MRGDFRLSKTIPDLDEVRLKIVVDLDEGPCYNTVVQRKCTKKVKKGKHNEYRYF